MDFLSHWSKEVDVPPTSFILKFWKKGVLPFLTHLLTKEQIENTTEAVETAASKAVGHNLLHGKFGGFINSIKIKYLA